MKTLVIIISLMSLLGIALFIAYINRQTIIEWLIEKFLYKHHLHKNPKEHTNKKKQMDLPLNERGHPEGISGFEDKPGEVNT